MLLAISLALPAAAPAKRSAGDLSPRLAKLATPALRSAPHGVQARRLSLAEEGAGSLLRKGNRVVAYVRFDRGASAALDELRGLGAQTLNASRRYQTVTVATKPAQLPLLARLPGVEGVVPALTPVTAAACPSGEIVSEGDGQLRADIARAGPPLLDGAGITVGILSNSFDQATEAADGSGNPVATKASDDVASEDLPGEGNECDHVTEVDVIAPQTQHLAQAFDEGRAMAQIVHDLAPGANLKFASAFNGEPEFAENISDLRTAGADVIVDDVFYPEEPFFQDGPVAVAANEAVADGAAYFSAAGNDNLIDSEGNDFASWETPVYRDAQSCPVAVEAKLDFNAFHCLDFHPGVAVDRTFGFKVEPGSTLTIDLQWDEPRFGVETDLDAFLLNSNGSVIKVSSEDNGKTKMPFELIIWKNPSGQERTVQLVVNRFSGETPRVKFGLIQSGVLATEYPKSTGEDVVGPTIFGHSGAAGVVSVGAVRFDTESEPEEFSSRGPVRRHFGPVVGTTPADPIPAEVVSKPDLVATDCGRTTFFSFFRKITFLEPEAAWHFCGTSAAAPHAAAVAALMREAEPAAEPPAVRAALYESAKPVGLFGACAVGEGLLDAVDAVAAVEGTPAATGPECELPLPGDPENAAAPGEWGSETPPPVVVPTPPTTTKPSTDPPPPPPKVAPRTFFRQRPGKVVRTGARRARVVFRFGSNVAGASFACRVDGGLFRICPSRFVRRFRIGRHTVRVSARDGEGNGDRSPAVYRFKVKRRN